MRQETVLVPGGRSIEATLDEPDDDASVCVVACPPHPQYGGHRGDRRLTAIGEYLAAHGVATLRFDYGAWDRGIAEREDARNALRWAAERYDRVGIVGFSFGGAMAALAAATTEVDLCGVVLLAPAAQVNEDVAPSDLFDDIHAPLRLVYGTRDTTAEWKPFYRAAEDRDVSVVSMDADHFFVGQSGKVAAAVGEFLVDVCGPES